MLVSLRPGQGDGTVRVWNYTARTCEIRADFGFLAAGVWRIMPDTWPCNDQGEDSPCAVAIHPFGYYAAVGFGDRIRLYHVLVPGPAQSVKTISTHNGQQALFLCSESPGAFFFGILKSHTCQVKDLKIHSEIPLRAINLLKFSFGGHLLAATQGKVIHIFSIRTLTKVGCLENSKIHRKWQIEK